MVDWKTTRIGSDHDTEKSLFMASQGKGGAEKKKTTRKKNRKD